MGMYTELIFGARLKKETPKDVIDTLLYMMGNTDEEPENLAFKTVSGRNPLRGSGSYYFGVVDFVGKMWYDKIGEAWIISSRCNLKNYEDEIDTFLKWIRPYIDSGSGEREMYAIVTYEQGLPQIYYLEDESV